MNIQLGAGSEVLMINLLLDKGIERVVLAQKSSKIKISYLKF